MEYEQIRQAEADILDGEGYPIFSISLGEGRYTLQIIKPQGEQTRILVLNDKQKNVTAQFRQGLTGSMGWHDYAPAYYPIAEGDGSINQITENIHKAIDAETGA